VRPEAEPANEQPVGGAPSEVTPPSGAEGAPTFAPVAPTTFTSKVCVVEAPRPSLTVSATRTRAGPSTAGVKRTTPSASTLAPFGAASKR
jgi:hypothetical protein